MALDPIGRETCGNFRVGVERADKIETAVEDVNLAARRGVCGVEEGSLDSTISPSRVAKMNDAGWLLPGMVKAPLVEKAFHTMPLSLSVMNVMDGLRGTQDMVVVGESAVNEASTPIDYVGSGSQVITMNIK